MLDRVKQLLDGGPLAVQELHVVDDQEVDVAELVPETGQPLSAQALQKLGRELLGSQINAALAGAARRRPDPFGQVRFAATGRTMDIQRRSIPRLGYCLERSRMSEAASLADDERLQAGESPA
jgi:hypothetical protein